MESNIRVLIKRPGEDAEITTIGNDLDSFREIVGGHIEGLDFGKYGIFAYINEDGKYLGLEENFRTDYDIIVGNVVFFSIDGENEASLSDSQIEAICDWLGCDYEEV